MLERLKALGGHRGMHRLSGNKQDLKFALMFMEKGGNVHELIRIFKDDVPVICRVLITMVKKDRCMKGPDVAKLIVELGYDCDFDAVKSLVADATTIAKCHAIINQVGNNIGQLVTYLKHLEHITASQQRAPGAQAGQGQMSCHAFSSIWVEAMMGEDVLAQLTEETADIGGMPAIPAGGGPRKSKSILKKFGHALTPGKGKKQNALLEKQKDARYQQTMHINEAQTRANDLAAVVLAFMVEHCEAITSKNAAEHATAVAEAAADAMAAAGKHGKAAASNGAGETTWFETRCSTINVSRNDAVQQIADVLNMILPVVDKEIDAVTTWTDPETGEKIFNVVNLKHFNTATIKVTAFRKKVGILTIEAKTTKSTKRTVSQTKPLQRQATINIDNAHVEFLREQPTEKLTEGVRSFVKDDEDCGKFLSQMYAAVGRHLGGECDSQANQFTTEQLVKILSQEDFRKILDRHMVHGKNAGFAHKWFHLGLRQTYKLDKSLNGKRL